ncbi:hypothetical protein KXW29_001965 [Aspergillus fumigatus]|uniref:Uncharacterized protein n=2 Tax=Aspergillus fumigatus TaxID=746128 RepID=Q4WJS8_ASPFU|nr:conserved hypothetical protein [Aspergillus fumigatus Af293]EAL88204.1 conserved hypothetical protein [Aspergillus fumigatus Af293]KAH1899645.1 hypothetical protein KXV57_008945 [Aspergillus fumigatus]KAH2272358.1 hypothetical protein KXW02_001072 [Aspergillus fumigatus]KAH2719626.1 hypothetical protein KXW29_001965 [Aspergillus fumigatus]
MAYLRGGDRPFSIHKLLKMLLSPHQSNKPVQQESDMLEDVDEPPDHRFLNTSAMNVDDGVVYVKSPTTMSRGKESLLTRALKHSPELAPADHQDHPFYRSYHSGTVSGISTAELTSDGGLTSPSLSNTPSPPLSPQLNGRSGLDATESTVEANLGRKRCISFACGRKAEEMKPERPTAPESTANSTPAEPPKRKTVLTFVCPARDSCSTRERPPVRTAALRSRPRGSPAPVARKASPDKDVSCPVKAQQDEKPSASSSQRGVPVKGLGKFEESEATRFHEFASSVSEDDEWVNKVGEFTEKITMTDCMRKEIAIRKLGEEAEEEALEEEDEEEDEDDADSTIHDFSSDDGNESDNEAGFADSDDESDDGSEYEFWAPTAITTATSPQALDSARQALERRGSNTSLDSVTDDPHKKWPPALAWKANGRSPFKPPPVKMRPGTPNLPDSTDFVCGTLDEDRPLEVAYKSCIEQRRLSKQVIIPQDIDPSFPTSDIDDQDDLEEDEMELSFRADELTRGRTGGDSVRQHSPRLSPRRMMSPPPRRYSRMSPRRLRSPPPPVKMGPTQSGDGVSDDQLPSRRPQGVNISELVQRPLMTRTKSLPRTPNPFFTSLDKAHRWSSIADVQESPECGSSCTREVHTRGPIDIVEGLEKKRQKRREKFWRQHCRKAAKEQMERRPIPGKGAERMKELGLEVAERFRAYGVGHDAQLVLSV